MDRLVVLQVPRVVASDEERVVPAVLDPLVNDACKEFVVLEFCRNFNWKFAVVHGEGEADDVWPARNVIL